MTKLVMCIDAKGTMDLREGEVYTAGRQVQCNCRGWLEILDARPSVSSEISTVWVCVKCQGYLEQASESRLYIARRFIPLNDPGLREEGEKYSERDRLMAVLGKQAADYVEEVFRKTYGGGRAGWDR